MTVVFENDLRSPFSIYVPHRTAPAIICTLKSFSIRKQFLLCHSCQPPFVNNTTYHTLFRKSTDIFLTFPGFQNFLILCLAAQILRKGLALAKVGPGYCPVIVPSDNVGRTLCLPSPKGEDFCRTSALHLQPLEIPRNTAVFRDSNPTFHSKSSLATPIAILH